MEARTAGLSFLNKAAIAVLLVLICVAVAVSVLPEVRRLRSLEAELNESRDREKEILDEEDKRRRELTALRENPEYQELKARDLLSWYRPGELVFRIRRD